MELLIEKEEIKNGEIITGKVKGKLGKVKIYETRLQGDIVLKGWDDNKKIDYFFATEKSFFGYLSSKIGHPFFVVKDDIVECYIDYYDTEFDDYVEIEPLVILHGNVDMLVNVYADMVKKNLEPSFSNWNPIGWSCKWNCLTNFKESLDYAKKYPFEVFQIDFWYKNIGDWEPKFSSFEEIAKEIKSYGMKPGIWIAPFVVLEGSDIFKEKKNWVVKDEKGNPKKIYNIDGKGLYALDLTNNEVEEHIRNIFLRIKNAGFEYFKLDFLFAGIVEGKRKKNLTPIQAYRKGLKLIRDLLGEFIVGVRAPLLPSIGYVDGMKITDISEKGLYGVLRDVITRYFMNGRGWWNAPDFLLGNNISTTQKKLFFMTVGILNNMLFLSDSLKGNLENYLFKAALKLRGGKVFVKNIGAKGYEIKAIGTNIGDVRFRLCIETEKSEFYIE
ncbi:glycoside hydrolase family 36 protein [Thermosipho sp. 1223]|uniref:glycoside hydrolase family 36 protein n=1 Tax=Thermosipho sp. 1223 TaxID=1643332 RepID=UPI000987AA24|nr:glycoside hydrolase family 36 protein [Thermosipho sp. 1223]OOC46790.1 hypothetical protein XO09_04745 [Thermosipho sp. 1223]